ncbi:Rho/RAC guanine nucleotide exchange factor, putative [Entamoeba dispar SAW760]|uniref:Rho/RAC guanine nucleotide exchange factor, putative n=1 Tax=Entamoeba dispar (strain ATCC PRA-260 / SAW760) TaxID=370354 RepID=B0EML0_ENTDS|nr:Rho/RAC guanine nucleotide exchange factor, putative [Entamoeba dispar SAW760]EDR24256.1 Rho/RAC guanine nucleotide exchange factor, putative [Entamoeba dispar SAW760]|eukprot:EDR24256.1 Rho/RAC guanine nucleotide exchange factor, putative [Entamoeba dispar SAW760]
MTALPTRVYQISSTIDISSHSQRTSIVPRYSLPMKKIKNYNEQKTLPVNDTLTTSVDIEKEDNEIVEQDISKTKIKRQTIIQGSSKISLNPSFITKKRSTLILDDVNQEKKETITRHQSNEPQNFVLNRKELNRISITKRMSKIGSRHNSSLVNGITKRQSSIIQGVKNKQERFKVVKELLSSETTYVTNLKTLMEEYMEPCYNKSILPKRTCDIIFAGIKSIYFTNKKFQVELNDIYGEAKSVEDGKEDLRFEQMTKCFLKFVDVFKLYSSFVNNYDNARTTTENELKENKLFHDMCDNTTIKPMSSNGILSLLILPVQRIPRYVMLVKDLCKWTQRNQWSNNLALLKEKIDGLGKLINDSKKKQKQMDLLKEYNLTITNFEKIIGEEFVNAARCFISEYDVFVYYKHRVRALTLIIFTDVLILCKKEKKGSTVIYGAKLQFCKLYLSSDELNQITSLKTSLLKKKGEKFRPFLDACFGLEVVGKSIAEPLLKPRTFLIWQNSSYPSSAAKIDILQSISAWQQVLRNNNFKRRESLAFDLLNK